MNTNSSEIKVLTVCNYVTVDKIQRLSRNQTGYGYMVSAITRSLSNEVSVDVFCWSGNYKAFVIDGIKFLDNRYLYLLPRTSIKSLFKACLFILGNLFFLREALRTAISIIYADFFNNIAKNYQCIHIHGCNSNLYPLILKLAAEKKNILITLHGLLSFGLKTNSLNILSERKTLHLFQKQKNIHLTVLTPAAKKKIIERYGKDVEDRIAVIPNFSASNVLTSDNKKILRQKKIIQYIGNISKNKNQQAIIKLVKKHREKLIGKVIFRIIGDGNFKDLGLKKIIQQNKDLIELTGPLKQDEVINSYKFSDLTLLLSKVEGFGLSVIESLENKVPVLISSKMEIASYFNESSMVTFVENIDDLDEIQEKIYVALKKVPDFNDVTPILKQFKKENVIKKYLEELNKI